jgi:hypothetical protein
MSWIKGLQLVPEAIVDSLFDFNLMLFPLLGESTSSGVLNESGLGAAWAVRNARMWFNGSQFMGKRGW